MADWIPYETGDEPSLEVSIDVDFDDDAAFRETHPYALTVAVSGFSTDGDGQPDDTVVDALYELEQRIDAACEANDAALACTVSGEASYRMIAYASSEGAGVPVREALEGARFRTDVRVDRDPSWSAYGKYVLRGEDRERARDADLIEQMREAGEDLCAHYDVTFMWDLADRRSLKDAQSALHAAGLEAEIASEDDGYGEDPAVYVTSRLVLSADALAQKRAEQASILAPFDAHYVDWEIFSIEE